MFVFATSCAFQYQAKSEMVEQIKIGMSSEEVFDILPGDASEWDECDDGKYKYGWNFKPPSGDYYKKTFWVIIKDGKVINVYTI